MFTRSDLEAVLPLIARLTRLTSGEARILHLREVEGRTHQRIAAELGTGTDHVRDTLTRIERRFEQYLAWRSGAEVRLTREFAAAAERAQIEAELRQRKYTRGFGGDLAGARGFVLRLVRGPRPSNPAKAEYDALGRRVLGHPTAVVVCEETGAWV